MRRAPRSSPGPDAVVYGHPDLWLGYDLCLRLPVAELPTQRVVVAQFTTGQ